MTLWKYTVNFGRYEKKILALAERIAVTFQNKTYEQRAFKVLCRLLDRLEPPNDIACFTVNVANHAAFCFDDDYALSYTHEDLSELTDRDRVASARMSLMNELTEPNEQTEAVSLTAIPLKAGGSLFCCALVCLEGYDPVVSWYAPYLSDEDALVGLARDGYVHSAEDVAKLPDSLILSLWKR